MLENILLEKFSLYRFFEWQVVGTAVIKHQRPYSQICIGLVDAILRPKVLGDRLGILTLILIAKDYNISFSIYFKEVTSIYKKQKHLLRRILGSPHTSNLLRIYLVCNRFSNYVYFRDMYKTLKEIGNSVCIGVKNLANLEISKLHKRLHYKK